MSPGTWVIVVRESSTALPPVPIAGGEVWDECSMPKHTLPIVLYTFLNIVLTTVHGRMVGGVMERGLVADGREGMVAGV